MVPSRPLSYVLLLGTLLLAAFLRLYRLDELPPGLHYDEGFQATMAQGVLQGTDRPIFFLSNQTEEPLAIYTVALAFQLLGASPWSLRLVSAIAGILTVAALYVLAVGVSQKRWLAVLAAFVLAILYWHLNFSRLGMEPILLPLVLTLSLAFLWRGLRGGSLMDFALAGILLGLTQYTYKAALAVPLLFVLFLGIEFVIDDKFRSIHLRNVAVCAIVSVLVFAPLGLYFAAHPSLFLERPGAVTTVPGGATTLVDGAIKAAGMFFVQGDDNPRSNLPGRPALDPFLAVAFIVGLFVSAVHIRRRESRFLLLWLIIGTLPTVISDFPPHFGRGIGATPALALLVARGMESIAMIRLPGVAILRPALILSLVAGLAFSAFSTFHDYFDVWGTRTGLYDSFDVGYWTLAQKLRDRPANEVVYLSPVEQEHYTIRFGLGGRAAHSFDGRRVLVLPPPGITAIYGIITREDSRSLALLSKLLPQSQVVERAWNFAGEPYSALVRVEGQQPFAPQTQVHARLGDTIELIGYDLRHVEKVLTLNLYWGCIAEMPGDYTIFVHVLGKQNPETQSSLWAQEDAIPGHGTYPTWRWQAGEVIVDDFELTLPSSLPTGEYQIEVGMYDLQTGARLPVTASSGARMENDRVLLKRISLP